MIDFSPLFNLLREKNMLQKDIYHIASKSTVNKMKYGDANVELKIVAELCLFLDVPIEKVVKINRIKQK